MVTATEWVVFIIGNDDLTSTVTSPGTSNITVPARIITLYDNQPCPK